MAMQFESFGLGLINGNVENLMALVRYVAANGKPITGYTGCPYLNMHLGKMQMILRTGPGADGGTFEVVGIDTHCRGNCVWTMRVNSMTLTPDEADPLKMRCGLQRLEDNSGLVIADVVNGDVLPGLLEGDIVTLQMMAFPLEMTLYENEAAYEEQSPADEDGKKWLLADGTVFPSGLLANHSVDGVNPSENRDSDAFSTIRGTVKDYRWVPLELFGKTYEDAFLILTIGTQFGDLEIAASGEQIPEEQQEYLHPGAVVYGVFALAGDAAIYEYEKGIVLDEPHDLALLRNTFLTNTPKRLWNVMSQEVVYASCSSGVEYSGRAAVISRISNVGKANTRILYASMATVVSVDSDGEALPYGAGKRCIVLAYDNPEEYDTLVFIEVDEEGRVSRMTTTRDGRYHFRLDETPEPKSELPDGLELPKSVEQLMLNRARYRNFVRSQTTDETVYGYASSTFEAIARRMLKVFKEENHTEDGDARSHLFGYLFAKAIEVEENGKQRSLFRKKQVVTYSPGDAFSGRLQSVLKPEQHSRLERARKEGESFGKDFVFYTETVRPDDTSFTEELVRALIFVQRLGQLYAAHCFSADAGTNRT